MNMQRPLQFTDSSKEGKEGQMQLIAILFLFLLPIVTAAAVYNITNSSQNFSSPEVSGLSISGTEETSIDTLIEATLGNKILNESEDENLSDLDLPEKENLTDLIADKPELYIELPHPEKVTRGEAVELSAKVTNYGNGTADNVVFEWLLPYGFEVVLGDTKLYCGNLAKDSFCSSTITINASYSTLLGENNLKILVAYDE